MKINWQPMDKSPKNKGTYLVWDGYCWYISYFCIHEGKPLWNPVHWATHWMSLTKPK